MVYTYEPAHKTGDLYEDEDGYCVVECPSLKGCNSQGRTREEALSNIKEAIAGYVTALEEDSLECIPVLQDSF
jgi:predicted RNase H-like HicB family nuclease